MPRTPRIRILRDNIAAMGWHITAFEFHYNQHDYIVLFEDSKGLGYKSEQVTAFLTFIDQADETRRLEVRANTQGFDGPTAYEIMDYFQVERRAGARGFFPAFYELFNNAMPEHYVLPATRHIRDLQAIQLGKRDRDPNPNALYCFDTKRNPKVNGKQYQRTIFNTNKTQLLRETLYNEIGAPDPTVSFCYSDNPDDECSDMEIRLKLARREGKLL